MAIFKPGDNHEEVERLSKLFHEGFRKEILTPPWDLIAEGYRFATYNGIRAVLAGLTKGEEVK